MSGGGGVSGGGGGAGGFGPDQTIGEIKDLHVCRERCSLTSGA